MSYLGSALSKGYGIAKNVPKNPCQWSSTVVVNILERMDYLGHTVNFKTHRKSYKQKKKIENDKSEWKIFENTHEPIIDQSTFDIVQKIRANRKRPTKMGEMRCFRESSTVQTVEKTILSQTSE